MRWRIKPRFQSRQHAVPTWANGKPQCVAGRLHLGQLQYWPKVTRAVKRASHVGCEACNARIQRVLHRICYPNVAQMKRASSVHHPRNIRTTSAWHSRVITAFDTRFMSRLLRACRPFMYCRCLAVLARRKCAGPWVNFGQYCTSIAHQSIAISLHFISSAMNQSAYLGRPRCSFAKRLEWILPAQHAIWLYMDLHVKAISFLLLTNFLPDAINAESHGS
jgi:hypothetical protein